MQKNITYEIMKLVYNNNIMLIKAPTQQAKHRNKQKKPEEKNIFWL